VVPKRKQWNAEQGKGSKRMKAEVAVKSINTENDELPDGVTKEAYELMVKGMFVFCKHELFYG
jgi:hypothetical protein